MYNNQNWYRIGWKNCTSIFAHLLTTLYTPDVKSETTTVCPTSQVTGCGDPDVFSSTMPTSVAQSWVIQPVPQLQHRPTHSFPAVHCATVVLASLNHCTAAGLNHCTGADTNHCTAAGVNYCNAAQTSCFRPCTCTVVLAALSHWYCCRGAHALHRFATLGVAVVSVCAASFGPFIMTGQLSQVTPVLLIQYSVICACSHSYRHSACMAMTTSHSGTGGACCWQSWALYLGC